MLFRSGVKYVTLCATGSKREVRNVRNVLIADDDASLRSALKLALEANGYEVRLAANGGEALALQRKSPAHVLITDIFMPESDGFEAIDGFRKAFPATKIIAMSGDAKRAKREYLSAAALIGVDATLKKPFQVVTLLQALQSLGI
jgi:CheY-like chemotaxis protein